MNIEMNETYARDTSTVWEHEIISSASDLKEWIKYEGAKYPKRTCNQPPEKKVQKNF